MPASAKLAEVMANFKYAGQVETARTARARAQRQLRVVLTVLGALAVIGVSSFSVQ